LKLPVHFEFSPLEQLRTLRQQIPELVQLFSEEVTRLRRLARVSADFAHEALSAVGASGAIAAVIGNSPEELHQAEGELARWTAVESELRSMLRGIVSANLVRRHRLGRVALQTYNVSRRLAREEEHANLRPHVERLSQIRKLGRRRPRTTAAAPEAQPQAQQPARPQ
jgi:hypothetical protein